MYEITRFILTAKKFEKFIITHKYILSVRLSKLRIESEIINNSCGDISIFESLIGLN